MRTREYKKDLFARLADSEYAASYLQEVLLNEGQEEFLIALKNVVQARTENMSKASESAGITRQTLYNVLSESGNPTLSTLRQVLDSIGLQLSIAEKEAA